MELCGRVDEAIPKYTGDIDLTRVPTGRGNEAFEVTFGNFSDRLQSLMRNTNPWIATPSAAHADANDEEDAAARLASASSSLSSLPTNSTIRITNSTPDTSLLTVSSTTSSTSPHEKAMLVEQQQHPQPKFGASRSGGGGDVLLDADVVTMPNSPWSSTRKRVGIRIPRQATPLALASYSSTLALAIALGWVLAVFLYSCWYYNSFGHIIVEFILCCLSFLGVLWNTYFTTTSLLKVCIPANNFCENGAYYSLQPEEKANDDVFLDVTIQLPVYLESFDEVIQLTLQSCLNSAKYYTTHTNATANIVVCDDGIMALLQNCFEIAQFLWTWIENRKYHHRHSFTIERVRAALPQSIVKLLHDEGVKVENLEEVIRRLLFYSKHDIGFVARSTLDRRGKFKKASNLNTHLRLAFGALQIQDEKRMTWEDAIKIASRDDHGQLIVFCSNNIQIGSLIVLNDSDSRMAVKVIQKTVPEFLNDQGLAFTQHSTKIMDEQRGQSFFLRLIGVYTDALYQGHFLLSSIIGVPPPLVGHSCFIRTDAIRQCGRMRTLRIAQSWLNNLGLSFVGANSIRYDRLQCPVICEYWSESHVSEDFELMIQLYNLGYKGRYIAFPDCEFQEGVTRTFDEEATRHRKFSLGAHELMFNPWKDLLGHGIFTDLFRTFLTCDLPSYYKIYLAAYLQSYVAGGIFLFIAMVTAIVKLLGFNDTGSLFANTPAAIIILSFIVYYAIGYTSFIIAMLRMKKYNKNLLFSEYRNISAINFIYQHLRYAMLFQISFSFPMINVFFFGAMDHLFSRERMVNATNKDSMEESRWKALKGVLRSNWGYWCLATIMAALAAATILQETSSFTTATVIEAANATGMPTDIVPVPCTVEECHASNCSHDVAPFACLLTKGDTNGGGCSPIPWLEGTCMSQCDLTECASLTIPGNDGNSIYIFGYPMVGLSLLAVIVPFLLNPYVWPIRPNKVEKEDALKSVSNQLVEV